MASTNQPSAAIAAAAILVLVATSLLATAEASTLTVFTGPGCSGKTKDVNYVCGCYSISAYPGGYHFVFTEGQKAELHRSYNCADRYPAHLMKETRFCYHTGYNSVKMIC